MLPVLHTRIPPPIVAAFAALIAWALAHLGGRWTWPPHLDVWVIGLVIATALSIDALALIEFRRAGTTVSPLHPERADRLVTQGIYLFSRNPMYLGMTLLLCAWALRLASVWAFWGPALFVAYLTHFQIKPEEAALTAKFGEHYRAYTRRVRRWI